MSEPISPQAPDEQSANGGVPTTLVQVSRSMDPLQPAISERVMQRHEESLRQFPNLNLSPGEFVLSAVRRHPIGLIRIWIFTGLFIATIFTMVALFTGGGGESSLAVSGDIKLLMYVGAVFMSAVFLLGALVATYVYNSNRFYLTNESVIQEIQISPFSRNEQTVSLVNIEDASYRQNGIIPTLFNYGSIRLSTEGDETTYRFNYVSNPKYQISLLNNAVEAFKNGRPVIND
jgi:hypothetical protein